MDSVVFAAWVGALAAILSGFVAGAVSWRANRSTLRTELEKVRLGLRHTQAQALQTARLRHYPELYRLVSGTVKAIRSEGFGSIALTDLRTQVETWDSNHALLLSTPATRVVYSFREHLAELCRTGGVVDVPEAEARFIGKVAEVELALKADLGVLGLDFYNPERAWRFYHEIEDEYDRHTLSSV